MHRPRQTLTDNTDITHRHIIEVTNKRANRMSKMSKFTDEISSLSNSFMCTYFDSRCIFGSVRCRNGTIKPMLTDLGVCYTFNNDPENQLVSDASGKTNSNCSSMASTRGLLVECYVWQQYHDYCHCL